MDSPGLQLGPVAKLEPSFLRASGASVAWNLPQRWQHFFQHDFEAKYWPLETYKWDPMKRIWTYSIKPWRCLWLELCVTEKSCLRTLLLLQPSPSPWFVPNEAQGFLADPALAWVFSILFNQASGSLVIDFTMRSNKNDPSLSLDCFLANALVSICACSFAFNFFFKRRSSRFNLGKFRSCDVQHSSTKWRQPWTLYPSKTRCCICVMPRCQRISPITRHSWFAPQACSLWEAHI